MQSYVEPSLKDAKPTKAASSSKETVITWPIRRTSLLTTLVFNLAVALKDTFGK